MLEIFLASVLAVKPPAITIPNACEMHAGTRRMFDRWKARWLIDNHLPTVGKYNLDQEYEAGRFAYPIWREVYAEGVSRGLIWSGFELITTAFGNDEYHIVDRNKCTSEAAAGALLLHCMREQDSRKK
jgi:hypothetical protein